MGIISSTFLSLAVQLAWNCQRFLDPRYRFTEPNISPEDSSVSYQFISNGNTENELSEGAIARRTIINGVIHNNRFHQENRNRRVAQLRYRRRRRSSFDAALIAQGVHKIGPIPSAGHRVISSTPNTLTRQQAPVWNASSSFSSSSSSSSTSTSSQDSDIDVEVNETKIEKRERKYEKSVTQPEEHIDNKDDISGEEHTMTAAEEAAFRMTIGRGHFSRSKKDRFFNNLRLEKRLNDLNREFVELACHTHSRSPHRHSGDLRKIV